MFRNPNARLCREYTPQDSAIVFIDHQPQMTFGVANTPVFGADGHLWEMDCGCAI
jgi:hypothetical protein